MSFSPSDTNRHSSWQPAGGPSHCGSYQPNTRAPPTAGASTVTQPSLFRRRDTHRPTGPGGNSAPPRQTRDCWLLEVLHTTAFQTGSLYITVTFSHSLASNRVLEHSDRPNEVAVEQPSLAGTVSAGVMSTKSEAFSPRGR